MRKNDFVGMLSQKGLLYSSNSEKLYHFTLRCVCVFARHAEH